MLRESPPRAMPKSRCWYGARVRAGLVCRIQIVSGVGLLERNHLRRVGEHDQTKNGEGSNQASAGFEIR